MVCVTLMIAFIIGSARLDNVVKCHVFRADFLRARVVVRHTVVVTFQISPCTGCHITLIPLIAEDSATRIQSAAVIQATDKYPSQIGQNTTGISACQLRV